MYISGPFQRTEHALLLPATSGTLSGDYTGKLARGPIQVQDQFIKKQFPAAQTLPFSSIEAMVLATCRGDIPAAFMEMRMALLAVRSPPAGCDASKLRVQ